MKVAIVGCGGLGHVHADCYAKIPGVTLVAVCDTQEEAAQKLAKKNGATAYMLFAEMLEISDCDVVSITLPSHLHKPFTIQAAEAGKHVICEKPIALNRSDAAEMINVCKKNGVRLFVGHVVRFYPEYKQMKQKIDEGALGHIGVAHAKRAGSHPGDIRPWFKDYEKSGGVVMDLMVHDIDFMRWALGDIRSVYGLHRCDDFLDYALATLVFESGAVANLEAFWGYPGPFLTEVEIAGSKGIIHSDNQKTKSLHIRKKASSGEVKPFVDVPQSPSYQNPFELELNHFIECIRHNQEPIVTAQDAYKALEIALAVLESSSSGRVVTFDRSTQEGMP